MFLGIGGKNKVRMRDRKELSLGLAALRCSLAENASRPHRDQRLYQLVTLVLGIGFRLHERGQAIALVRFQDVPGDGSQHGCDQHNDQSVLGLHPTQEQPHNGNRQIS